MSLPSLSSSGSGTISPQPYVPPPAPQPYLPGASWTKPVASRSDINSTATTPADQQLQMIADGAPLRVIYGPDRIGADLADALVYQNKLVMHLVWGEGEIEAVDDLQMNDLALPAGVIVTHYAGTAGQIADPILVAAYATHGITYADDLPGIAYSVVIVPANVSAGFPDFTARIRGRKLYDPRTDTTVYSDNPALALADAMSNTVYGMGKTVDWTSVGADADACDALVGTEKRRIIGLTCAAVAPAAQWIETLRTYASCFVVQGGSGMRLIPDRPGSSTFSFGSSGDSKILADSLRLKKRGGQNIPTVMRIEYTDTTKTPWATGIAEVKAAGVDSGTTERRVSTVSLPGINRYSQAYREAVERINKLTLGDLDLDWVGFDEALAVETGDIVDVSSDLGLAAKMVRVTAASHASPGRPRFSAGEYDPAMYSDVVQSEPTFADTELPNPAEPPAVTGLLAVEEVFQLENGLYSSRIKATWTAADYPYLRDYRIEITRAGDLIATATPREAIYRTGAVQEAVEYVVKVAAISSIGAVGEWAQYNVTPLGKSLIPGDVPSLTIFEAGGRVYGTAGKAVDIDILRYAWRYWPVGGSWATGIVIDEADSLRMISDTIPEGTWVVGVKAVDSVRQTSANAKTATVVVTSDSNSFLVDAYESDTPTLTNMAAYTLHPTDPNTYYITEDGVAWGTKFPAAMSTYVNPIGSYHNSVTSTWLGEAEDFGLLLSGQWNGEAVVADVSGSHASSMGFSTDGSAYSYLDGLSHKTNARFARLKHEALTTSTMKVTVPGQTIRLNAVPRVETIPGTSSASAGVLVQLEGTYVAVQALSVNPEGSTARYGLPDRVLVAPEHGLLSQCTVTGGGNGYSYWKISNCGGRVIQGGDTLEYEFFVVIAPQSNYIGGAEFDFTDATNGRGLGLTCSLGTGLINHAIGANGVWVARKIPMTAAVGKTVSFFDVACEADTAGDYKCVYRNIRITDGAGTTRLQIWESGEPPLNANNYSALTTSQQVGPANSLLASVFDSSGTRIVSAFRTSFNGV